MPAWAGRARTTLAGTLIVAFGTDMAVSWEGSGETPAFYVVMAGLVLALMGIATWPRRRNNS